MHFLTFMTYAADIGQIPGLGAAIRAMLCGQDANAANAAGGILAGADSGAGNNRAVSTATASSFLNAAGTMGRVTISERIEQVHEPGQWKFTS